MWHWFTPNIIDLRKDYSETVYWFLRITVSYIRFEDGDLRGYTGTKIGVHYGFRNGTRRKKEYYWNRTTLKVSYRRFRKCITIPLLLFSLCLGCEIVRNRWWWWGIASNFIELAMLLAVDFQRCWAAFIKLNITNYINVNWLKDGSVSWLSHTYFSFTK